MSVTAFLILRFVLFAAEMVSVEFMFFKRFEKKKCFALRVLLCAAALVAFAVAIAFLNDWLLDLFDYNENDIHMYVLVCLSFVVLFALTVVAYGVCYRSDVYSLMFCGISSYCARHLVFSIYVLIVNLACPAYNIYSFVPFSWIMLPIYLAVYTVMNIAVYFMFARRIHPERMGELGKEVLLFSLIALLINMTINAVSELNGRSRSELYMAGLVLQAVCMVLMLSLLVAMVDRVRLINEKRIINTILEQQEKQYKFAEYNAEMLGIRAHDLKHQIAVLRAGGEEAEELLSELEGLTAAYDYVTNMQHNAINTVIAEKWLYCRAHDIKLSRMVDPEALAFMENIDVYSLIGNMLDNSVEAVMNIKDKDRRVISVTVSERGGVVSLSTNNYYEGEIVMSDGLPVTAKSDKSEHGFGLRSIKRIVEKYDGNMQIKTDGNIFILCITFFKS